MPDHLVVDQCSAVSAVQFCKFQCSAVQCSAVQCSAVQCSAVQCSAVLCTVLLYREACLIDADWKPKLLLNQEDEAITGKCPGCDRGFLVWPFVAADLLNVQI